MSDEKEKYVMAIDLGTSGPKVALMTTKGDLAGFEFEPVELILRPGGGAEQDPDEWWKAITTAARRLHGRLKVPVDDVVGLGCTGQWSGTVAVDRSGRPVGNAVIWMDSRGAPHVARMIDGLIKLQGYAVGKLLRWIRLTGGIPARSGKDPVGHMLYLKAERPEVYRETYKFLEPKDYLNLRMTGRFAASYDSITLYWMTDNRDIENIRYDPGLVALSGIEADKLPELMRATDVLGPLTSRAAEELGLGPHVKVVAGTPDQQSAAVGSGAIPDYAAHLYIGTSSWLNCHVPFKKTDLFHNMASLPSAIPDRYFVANEQETAGKCVSFLLDNLVYPDDELSTGRKPDDALDRLDRLVSEAPAGSGRVLFAPWLYGERTPVEDHRARGAFLNLSLDTNRAHLARAVLEGVAYNTRWLMGHVEKFIKRRLDAMDMIGGGAQSDIWCQIFADVLNRTVRQVDEPIQANVRGAGYVALVGLGYLEFADIPGLTRIRKTYQPLPGRRRLYDELYEVFLEIYQRNRPLFARLNRPGW